LTRQKEQPEPKTLQELYEAKAAELRQRAKELHARNHEQN